MILFEDFYRFTFPQFQATEAASKSTVEWLLSSGASPFRRNLFGQTAIDISRALDRKEILDVYKSMSFA